jgi:tetratricopeptide (TPR) repeat protein
MLITMKQTMTKYLVPVFALLLCSSLLSAQVPSVQLKVRGSKLFGLSAERFARIDLSNRTRSLPLTCDNVHAGPYIYFIFRPAGSWNIDVDYLNAELPKLTLNQGERKLSIAWKGEVVSDTGGTSVLVGFSNDLKLFEPFLARFEVNGVTSQANFTVPPELWLGYSTLVETFQSGERALEQKRYPEAIAIFERALRNDTLQIFPRYPDLAAKRTQAFERFGAEAQASFLSALADEKPGLKARISQIDQCMPTLQLIVDSLPNAGLKASPEELSIKRLVDNARNLLAKVKAARDSLQVVLDDQNVRWIVEGTSTGKNGYLYQYMVETLAYAFSSPDFADTTAANLKMTMPAEIQARLTKYNITESYETFLRQCNARRQQHAALLPAVFLDNLRKDSTAFPLPYYSMLKAVNDYYAGNLAGATEEIFRIFRTCYDPELSERFDQMRVLINFRHRGLSPDVMRILDEAMAAERAGNNEVAADRYREASRIAPDFAYAAYAWGKFYVHTGDPIRALTFFERAYQTDSLYLSAYREAYSLYRKSGNYKPMIDVLTRALACGNDYWETNFNLGVAYTGDGDLARAIKHFERALELNPGSYQTNIQLGLAHQTAKNYQKAREYFNRAINIDPIRQEAVNFLDKLNELQKAGR